MMFSYDDVTGFVARVSDSPVDELVVAVEPVAGCEGPTSDFVIVTVGGDALIAMDRIADVRRPEDYETVLLNHLRRLKRRFGLRVHVTLDVEAGTGLECAHISRLAQEVFPDLECLSDYGRKPGTRTTESKKQAMMQKTREVLPQMCVSSRFFTSSLPVTDLAIALLSNPTGDVAMTFQRAVYSGL
jgi:hypothetical protein